MFDCTLPLWVVKGSKKDMACVKRLCLSLSLSLSLSLLLFSSIGISLIDINETCWPSSISEEAPV